MTSARILPYYDYYDACLAAHQFQLEGVYAEVLLVLLQQLFQQSSKYWIFIANAKTQLHQGAGAIGHGLANGGYED